MAEENAEKIVDAAKPVVPAVQPPAPAPVQVAVPVAAKKPDAVDELAATGDAFVTNVQAAGVQALRAMLGQVLRQADNVLAKLDAPTGGQPPKKP